MFRKYVTIIASIFILTGCGNRGDDNFAIQIFDRGTGRIINDECTRITHRDCGD